jgi:hypothetical protein
MTQILQSLYLNEGKFDNGILKALIIIGGPNVGKSAYAQIISSGSSVMPRIYDADNIFEFLADKHRISMKQWADPFLLKLYNQTKPKNIAQLSLWINEFLPVVVLSAPDDIERMDYRIETIQKFGYDIEIFIVKPVNPEKTLNTLNSVRRRGVDPLYAKKALELTERFIEHYQHRYKTTVIPDIQHANDAQRNQIINEASKYFISDVKNKQGQEIITLLHSDPKLKNRYDVEPDNTNLAVKWYDKPYKQQEQQNEA